MSSSRPGGDVGPGRPPACGVGLAPEPCLGGKAVQPPEDAVEARVRNEIDPSSAIAGAICDGGLLDLNAEGNVCAITFKHASQRTDISHLQEEGMAASVRPRRVKDLARSRAFRRWCRAPHDCDARQGAITCTRASLTGTCRTPRACMEGTPPSRLASNS